MLPKSIIFLTVICIFNIVSCANILMMTLGGTKSHKIPFLELAKGLIPRGHNVTFINAFPADSYYEGLEEITPASLVFYVRNFTNWDLLGARMRGEEPVPILDILKYPIQVCDALYSDSETKEFLESGRNFDVMIMDGAFVECSVGISHHLKVPFMYINTVAFYMGSIARAGNPAPFSITPIFSQPYTNNMNLIVRAKNTLWHMLGNTIHHVLMQYILHDVLKNEFGSTIPSPYELSRNVSFILQNSHHSVTYPTPYLPSVAEIACLHCKPAKPLPKDLEEFINGAGEAGFIYVSMGSSVKASKMPEYLRRMLVVVFRQLPQRVLWKWENEDGMSDLPSNVKLSKWLPQQDLLGHPKIKAFVTHGGLLSMYETVYHAVPIVTLPVFCDHDSNAAKAELDGYAIKLELSSLTAEELLWSIRKLIHDPKFREAVKYKQNLIKDQKETPLERAVYWTEYIIRHKGAYHLQTPAKDMNILQYYLIDVICLLIVGLLASIYVLKYLLKLVYKLLSTNIGFSMYRKSIKLD